MDKTLDIHITIPESLLSNLDRLAKRRNTRRTQLVREAIEDLLAREEAERVQREMSEYIEAMSDQSDAFVAESDSHTVERLLRETKW